MGRKSRRIIRAKPIISSSSSSDTDSKSSSSDVSRRRERRSSSTSQSIGQQFTDALREIICNMPLQRPSTSGFRGDAVPIFDPEQNNQNITTWCRKVDEFQKVFNWSEESTIYYALGKLRGLAQTWYNGLTSVDYSWAEWKEKLIIAFPESKDYAEKVDEMTRRRKLPGESITRYYYEKMALINACGNITGRNAVSCIIYGLTDEHIKNSARARDCAEPEELFMHLRTLKDVNDKDSYTKGRKDDRGRVSVPFKRRREETSNLTLLNPFSATKRACYTCGRTGHVASQCFFEPNKQKPCNFCKKKGHDETKCYAKKRAEETTNVVS